MGGSWGLGSGTSPGKNLKDFGRPWTATDKSPVSAPSRDARGVGGHAGLTFGAADRADVKVARIGDEVAPDAVAAPTGRAQLVVVNFARLDQHLAMLDQRWPSSEN